jgi:hypothetical protein
MVWSANGIEGLSTTGLIYGNDCAFGPNYRGIWGLYGSYDYLAPQIFHLSTMSFSLGTTGQWWATQSIAVQGTVLAGLGYAAASSMHRTADERDYHYGAAPRRALRSGCAASSAADFSADMLARMVSLGSIDRRNAGRDEIANVDTALTWRIQGRHAVGVNCAWSHRSTSSPDVSGRRQTLGRVGLFYTLVAPDGSGEVDWRPPAAD